MLQVSSVKINRIGNVVEIIAPLPESVNTMYNRSSRRVRKSDKAKAYSHLLEYALNLSDVTLINGLVNVHITYVFKTMRSDIDNPTKLFLDSLQGHLYANDNQVVKLTQLKRLARNCEPCIIAEISPSPLVKSDLYYGE